MAPTAEGLIQFAELFKQEFGEELSQEEIEQRARAVLNLYIAIYRTPLEVAEVQKLFNSD